MSNSISVGDLIRIRKASPIGTIDEYHLSIVFESGGMRNVSSGGVASRFGELNLARIFNSFHGSSSGACVALYFAAEKQEDGVCILLDDICNREFIKPWDVFSSECIVKTHKIVQKIIAQRRDPGFSEILKNGLHVTATDCETGHAVEYFGYRDRNELFDAIEGTMKVPNIFRVGVKIRSKSVIDGSISSPIPINSAISAGATHVLVVCNRPRSAYCRNKVAVYLESIVLLVFCGSSVARQYIDNQMNIMGTSAPVGVEVDWIFLGEEAGTCSPIEIRREKLKYFYEQGRASATKFLRKINII